MAIKSYKMGPGTLSLGEAGTLIAIEAQVRSLTIRAAEQVDAGEAVPVLSGEELAAEESVTYDWTMVGNLIQDITAGGIVDWSWTNKGTPVPFTFIPSTTAGRQVTGTVIPVPLDFGGDVDPTARPEASLTWRIPADPTIAAVV